MPRSARLDAPGVLHHIIGRGIEKRPIFLTDGDRNDFISGLERLVKEGCLYVYAWTLLGNHFHLLSLQDGKDVFGPEYETATDGICGEI